MQNFNVFSTNFRNGFNIYTNATSVSPLVTIYINDGGYLVISFTKCGFEALNKVGASLLASSIAGYFTKHKELYNEIEYECIPLHLVSMFQITENEYKGIKSDVMSICKNYVGKNVKIKQVETKQTKPQLNTVFADIFRKLGLMLFVLVFGLISCEIGTPEAKKAIIEQYRPHCPMLESFKGSYINNGTLHLVYECETVEVFGLDSINLALFKQ